MRIKFSKYQGTGNDFVMIDNRSGSVVHGKELAARLCDRKFGVGADGVILLQNHEDCDFEMIYYNSDGSQSFCGNGSRCVVMFAKALGIIENETTFLAIDGMHEAHIEGERVHLKMGDVSAHERGEGYWFIDTGSPHYIRYVDDVKRVDIVPEAQAIRYNDRFKAEGTNVNFVQPENGCLLVRTYERGVEDETLSCGTGVTAVALSAGLQGMGASPCRIKTEGGELQVGYTKTGDVFTNIWLIGPGERVFDGEIEV